MKRAGLMAFHFLFCDGARAELHGTHVTLRINGSPPKEMPIDELPQARIDELLSYNAIKIVANPVKEGA